MAEWTDGEMPLKMELSLTVNYAEKGGKLYWQAYHKNDVKGEHNLAPYMDKEDREWVETCIIDHMNELDREAKRG